MEPFSQKVKDAIKHKNLTWKIKHKLFESYINRRRLYLVNNKNAASLVRQCNDYEKLYQKFLKTIQKGSLCHSARKQSDKVWICWFQGLDNAPELVKACIASAKHILQDKDIILLTTDNYGNFIQLPDYIIAKWKKGRISMAHFSDILRISLLAKWGGIWIDATVLCTDPTLFHEIASLPLFVFRQLDLSRQDQPPIVASSWFISCQSHHPIICLTRNLLFAYWKQYNFTINYYLLHLFFAMACRRYPQEWNHVPVFNNHSPHVLLFELKEPYQEQRWNQIMRMSSVHKLQRHQDFSAFKNSNYAHILSNYRGND